ncbi:hypothetical protein BJ878DRAFT_546694 [Calycina marina]|uniref:Uncharacterized protein n=1 Tax=Calycina marina TaxID=1763456 RepID=A0A9P7YVJ6_9HELO|nr:hypothetical protein BJ878DRAFT_546694 [Calycina marina]
MSPSLEYDSIPLPETSVHRRTLSSYVDSRNFSLNTKKVWVEDCFDRDREEVYEQGSCILPPPAAATTSRTFPKCVPTSTEEETCSARQPRTQQRSLTALLPFGSPTKSRGNSLKGLVKERKMSSSEEDMFTGEREAIYKSISKGGLGSWFTGSSAPVTVGISTQPTAQEMDSSSAISSSKAPSPPRFGFFSSKPASQIIQLPQHLIESDGLLKLDIHTALHLTPSSETFSPAAFKNLQTNAEGLLSKMQTAYKLLSLKHHVLSEDLSTQEEEFEEADMRAQHLKTQLDDMSKKFSEQDSVIENLVLELAHERQLRAEEKDAREKSIALVRENARKHDKCCSGHSEDLHADMNIQRRGWRNSGGSTTEYESDIDSSSDSVFSRSRSPTLTVNSATSAMTSDSTPEILQANLGGMAMLKDERGGIQRPKLVQQPSTFQKLMRANTVVGGISSPTKEVHGCSNCRGQQASVAWDTVGLLKAENKGLKDRVETLEDAVDNALDLCAGLGR